MEPGSIFSGSFTSVEVEEGRGTEVLREERQETTQVDFRWWFCQHVPEAGRHPVTGVMTLLGRTSAWTGLSLESVVEIYTWQLSLEQLSLQS
jgi:hypothetical protein